MMLLAVLVSIVTLCCASQATSPKLLYMQNQHHQPKPVTRTVRSAKDGLLEGSGSTFVLPATSIVYTQGADMSLESNRRFELTFRVPVERGYRDIDIQKSELLLFPNVTRPLPPTLQVDFITNADHFGMPVRRTYAWDTSQSCASLDITQLMRSIFRRSSLSGAEVMLRVDIGLVQPDISLLQNKSDQATGACAVLEKRNVSGIPFIVTKYFAESQRNGNIVPRQSGTEVCGCNLTTLFVNISAVFGPKVIFPVTLNIGNCVGSCDKSSNENYSYNAIAKRKMRVLDPNSAMLGRTYDVTCVPSSFEPVTFIVSDSGSVNILEIPDLVVTSCACR